MDNAVLNLLLARGNDNVTGADIHLETIIKYEPGISSYSAAVRAGMDTMFRKLGIAKHNIIPKPTAKRRKYGSRRNASPISK